jgi:hypothetical protein
MTRETIMKSVRSMKTTTKVLAWVFQVGTEYYQVCEYDARMTGKRTGIWKCNKTGSTRLSEEIYNRKGCDHLAAIQEFVDTLNIPFDEEVDA